MRPSLAVITVFVVAFPSIRILTAQQSPAPSSPLFQEQAPLEMRLEGHLRTLLRDKGAKRIEHPARLRYASATDSGQFDVKLRTRGMFRLKLCAFPPIRIDLPGRKVAGTLFAGQDKLKLVTHCLSGRSYEQNLLREYAVYRVFNALTDTSFRVRLAHITYIDSARADTTVRYGFMIESDAELAQRLGTEVFANDNINDLLTDPGYMTLVSVFQYLVGNTDWSVWRRHNIEILRRTTEPHILLAVPYDFDFSGAVGAPYATPPPQLPIRNVRERHYRGFCQPDSVLQQVLERFRVAKDSIYAAVRGVAVMPEKDRRELLSYFDEFYDAIENRSLVQREFVRGCRSVPQ